MTNDLKPRLRALRLAIERVVDQAAALSDQLTEIEDDLDRLDVDLFGDETPICAHDSCCRHPHPIEEL